MLLERAHSGESATYSVDTEVLSQSGIGDVASWRVLLDKTGWLVLKVSTSVHPFDPPLTIVRSLVAGCVHASD
jgi:hypothetical protein